MTIEHNYRLTEEIARWAFEVQLKQLPTWTIAFTNPTAGPWKRVMATDSKGKIGEVYRFPRESDRPDLILISDELEHVVIIEAKDSLPKLLVPSQKEKSINVVASLADKLRSLRDNAFWGARANYQVIPGLLWASDTKASKEIVQKCLQSYGDGFNKVKDLRGTNILIVEVLRNSTNQGLITNSTLYRKSNGGYESIVNNFAESFHLSSRK